MYKLLKDQRTNEVCAVEIVGANTSFPLNTENSDYQAYLKYIEQGGLVLPADAGAGTEEVTPE
jgi:hypothetical protein